MTVLIWGCFRRLDEWLRIFESVLAAISRLQHDREPRRLLRLGPAREDAPSNNRHRRIEALTDRLHSAPTTPTPRWASDANRQREDWRRLLKRASRQMDCHVSKARQAERMPLQSTGANVIHHRSTQSMTASLADILRTNALPTGANAKSRGRFDLGFFGMGVEGLEPPTPSV